jgi:uncharacterized tellurite resistance protein B-like protein
VPIRASSTDVANPDPAEVFSQDDLRSVALLALLLAHGADEELHPREIDAIARHLLDLNQALSVEEVMAIFRGACKIYALKGIRAEEIIAELARSLGPPARQQAYSLLQSVAEADEALLPAEFTLLSHIADAWDLEPDLEGGAAEH